MKGFKATPAVLVAVLQDGKILLLKRKNTGFMDGYWDMPSGHLEWGETFTEGASRELKEEAGLASKPDDLKLFHVSQNDARETPYFYYVFHATKWKGAPKVNEPNVHDDIKFFDLDKLPKETTPFSKEPLLDLKRNNIKFNYINTSKVITSIYG